MVKQKVGPDALKLARVIGVIFILPTASAVAANTAPTSPPAAEPQTPAPAKTAPVPATTPIADGEISGVTLVKTKDVVTGIDVKDCKVLTADDWKRIRQMEALKSVNLAMGFDGAALAILAGMPALESFTTNGSALTDQDLAQFAQFPNLHTLTFFHPGKGITGTGFATLASLPHLQGFTIGGSSIFGDIGMVQVVAGMPRLQEFRTWHTGVTLEGVKALTGLKELKSITLGQHLAMAPPATLNDDAVAVLAGITSLETINLQEARLDVVMLGKLKQIPGLKRLKLDNIELTGGDIDALRKLLPGVDVQWAAPDEDHLKRVNGIFGAPAK